MFFSACYKLGKKQNNIIRKILPLTFFTFISIVAFGQLNVELLSQVDYPNDTGNDVWGYVDSDGSEYGIFGTVEGVSVG